MPPVYTTSMQIAVGKHQNEHNIVLASFLSLLRTKEVEQSPALGSPPSGLWSRSCLGLPNALFFGRHLWFRLLNLGLRGFLRCLPLALGFFLYFLLFLDRLVRRVVFRLYNTISNNNPGSLRRMTYVYTPWHLSSSDF